MPMTYGETVLYDKSLLTGDDLFLFNEGSHFRIYEKLGAHLCEHEGLKGAYFAAWAPNAQEVCIMGDFNGWSGTRDPLRRKGNSGIWDGFVPGAQKGMKYKFRIRSMYHGYEVEKADPFGFYHEVPPKTASILWDLDYEWQDGGWMSSRRERNSPSSPIAIYEVHLGSWKRVPEENNRPMTYRELAEELVDYVRDLGFTHVEFLPVMEHPFYGSWGYQSTGYFAPTSRYGIPQDFMQLVDRLHGAGVGVIVDWVPSHFSKDEHGLGFFDGTHLYEHADPRQGLHPEWDSLIFNYGRREVQCFLISNALFWLDVYHVDGLRVDGVASMLYLDYGRKDGEWIPNEHGGKENVEAIQFIRRFNEEVYRSNPDTQTIAEESTSWPMVTRPTYSGGLGFGMKWDMGWMHDTLEYMTKDPVYRSHHHDKLTFRMLYAFEENFILPLSHDEVVYGKGSLLRKMPGDEWQKFANLRLLLAYMYAQPGKKLLFMGGEFGQWDEWYHEKSLDWHLAGFPLHAGVKSLMVDLNRIYRGVRALHVLDFSQEGFEWIDCSDRTQSILSLVRKARDPEEYLMAVFNFTPVPRREYRVGSPRTGAWKVVLNTDATHYGGSGMFESSEYVTEDIPFHGRDDSLILTLPPLAAIFMEYVGEKGVTG